MACTQRARFAYGRNEPWVQVERQADGSYYAEMCGHFSLRLSGDEPFRLRLIILFLRLLEAGDRADPRRPGSVCEADPNCGVVRGPSAECEPLGAVLAGRKLARSIEPEVSGSIDQRGAVRDYCGLCSLSLVG